jgi:hypothetical protein
MAKRKRKPGEREGFKFNLEPDYRSERFVMYIANVETGILQAGTISPDLTDGEVSQSVEDLMARLTEAEVFQKLLMEKPAPPSGSSGVEENNLVQGLILMNLRSAFEQYGPLSAEDTLGILGVIKTSVKRWGVGSHRRGYLTFLEGFLGHMGVKMRQLSDEEVETLELIQSDDVSSDKLPIKSSDE